MPTEAEGSPDEQALVQQVREKISARGIEIVVGGGADVNGIFRAKRLPVQQFVKNPHAPFLFSDYFFAMDTEENVIPPPVRHPGWWPGWERGFGDFNAVPDLSTFRVAPWLNRTAFIICDYCWTDGRAIEVSPRFVMQRQVERLKSMGLVSKLGAEFEFFLFRESQQSLEEKGYRSLQPLSVRLGAYSAYRGSLDEHVIRDIVGNLQEFGLAIDTWNPEGGAGQYEINMVFSEAMSAADESFLYKHAIKEIASRHGLMATFMAKTLPGFGSSCHIHQSLWSADDRNLFYDAATDDHLSDIARQYTAGLLATAREMTLLFAPTINSYKRFIPEAAAGTSATWGYENRTTGMRIMNHSENGCRVEHRIPGGDVNPYLAFAGCLAGGLHGIEEGLELLPPYLGNAYRDPDVDLIPTSMEEAIRLFESSEVARKYLGDEFVNYYTATRRWELEQFQNCVTDWEVRRYLEFL